MENNNTIVPFTNMMLILTDRCNLNCTYCYEKDFNGKFNTELSWDNILKSINLFISLSINEINKTIFFFGGEPHITFELIKRTIEYCEKLQNFSQKLTYVIVTNGTILTNEMFKFYCKYANKINIRISIDGFQDSYNKTRKTVEHKGAWELLYPNIVNFKKLHNEFGLKMTIISTICKDNYSEIYNNYTNIYSLTNMPINSLFVHEDNWNKSDYDIIKDQIIKLFKFHIDNNRCIGVCNIKQSDKKKSSLCSAGIKSFSVNYNGDIFPCHRCFYNNMGKSYLLGNVNTGISFAKLAFIHEINNINMLPSKCSSCIPSIRKRCHICFSSNYKAYNNPHFISQEYCMFQKELYYLLLEKELSLKF